MILKMNNAIRSLRGKVSKLAADRSGVAALEFALIAPLLITLYLGTMEISNGLQMNKKVSRAASTVGDLVTQLDESTLNKATIDSILGIGGAVTQPYNFTKPTVTITGIEISAAGAATISWSRKLSDTGIYSRPFTPGTVVTVPPKVLIASTFLVRVETALAYNTLTSWTVSRVEGQGYGLINMSETFYLRPRNTPDPTSFPCADC